MDARMNDSGLQRKMPFHIEAEQSVLGAILVDPRRFGDIAGIITVNDFYLEEHQEIFQAMQKLFLQSKDIDLVTLIDLLVREGVYDRDRCVAYMKVIAETVPTASNIKDYAAIVRDKSLLRQLVKACDEITDSALRETDEADMLLNYAVNKVGELASRNLRGDFVHIAQVLVNAHEELQEISERGGSVGTKTGYADLDRILVGMGKGDLIIVGARPGMGKTSFAMNIATNVAKKTGLSVGVFSMEMSSVQLAMRMLSGEAAVESGSLRTGKLSDEDWSKLAAASAELSECNIYIDDRTDNTVATMKAKLQRIRNLGLVIIDYLQLMQPDKTSARRSDSKANEVAEISRGLKLMAKDLGVPVICCSQLNRGPEKDKDKRPTLSELRDSGAIEQDADIVLLLYREEYYKKDPQTQNTAEVIVAKNRHGAVDTVKMSFIGKYTRFASLAREDDPTLPPPPAPGGGA